MTGQWGTIGDSVGLIMVQFENFLRKKVVGSNLDPVELFYAQKGPNQSNKK